MTSSLKGLYRLLPKGDYKNHLSVPLLPKRLSHPFHPLYGQQFEILSYRHNWANIGSHFTRPLSTSGHSQRPGPASFLLIPVSSSLLVARPFAWLISSNFLNSLGASKRGKRRKQRVKAILPGM